MLKIYCTYIAETHYRAVTRLEMSWVDPRLYRVYLCLYVGVGLGEEGGEGGDEHGGTKWRSFC